MYCRMSLDWTTISRKAITSASRWRYSGMSRVSSAGTYEMQSPQIIRPHWFYCISYVPALLTLDIPEYSHRDALLIAFLLIVVQSSDILQYIFGKLFGRHQIAPDVSPSKTVEGFVGGVAGATAVGAVLCRITPSHPWQAAGLALTITLNGFL